MKPVVVWRRARADRREIGEFIAADNPTRDRGFVSAPRTRCLALGWPAPDIALTLRIFIFRSYPILHRVLADRILIDRVLHSARDRSIVAPYE